MLAELDAGEKPTIMAFNKMDEVQEGDREILEHLALRYPYVVFLAARKGRGLPDLEDCIVEVLHARWETVDLTLPLAAADLVAELHARGEVQLEDYQMDGVHLIGRAPADLAARMARRAAGY